MNLKKISNLISNLAAKNWNEKCKKKKIKKIIKKGKKKSVWTCWISLGMSLI